MILSSLTFGWSRFFPCYSFPWPFPRPRIGVRPLAAHRQILSVPQAAIRTHIQVAFDVHRDLAPKIALDLIRLIDDLPDLDDIIIGESVAL
jgi:hypothetical protein